MNGHRFSVIEITDIPVEELRPNPWNSNVVSPENEAKIDEAIQRLGVFKPIIARRIEGKGGLEILGGEHRWEAAKRLGMPTVPTVDLGVIDDKRAKEISLADNARYGVDDMTALAEILQSIGSTEEIGHFLPYSELDVAAIFASSDIALDELELEEDEVGREETPEPPAPKASKTHTIMRFKLTLADAERLAKLIATVQVENNFTTSDDLTNAGDALVHLLKDESRE